MEGVTTIILTTLLAGLGWLLKNEFEKRREVEKQLSEKKYIVYVSIIELVFSIINDVRKQKEQVIEEEKVDKLFKIVEGLVIYGSDNVLKKFAYWKRNANLGNASIIMLLTDVIIEIRKDMGNQDTKMTMDDFWGMIITDYDLNKERLLNPVK